MNEKNEKTNEQANELEKAKQEEVKKDLEQTLEDDVKFSWGNVVKGWVQNLKDDVDPAIKGAKMGLFGLHAIPTWMRHSDEGKMQTEKPFLSGLLGFVVAGTSIAGYVFAGNEINQATDSELGYAVAAVPVACQGVSWAYEAFVRAKKTEQSKIVMTRLRRSFDTAPEEEYALTTGDIVDKLADKLYAIKEKNINSEVKRIKSRIAHVNKNSSDAAALESSLKECESEIESLNEQLENYKPRSIKHAKKGILYTVSTVFNGLVADHTLGKEYDMSTNLSTGPVKRQNDRHNHDWCFFDDDELDELDNDIMRYCSTQDITSMIGNIVKSSVAKNKGSANVELFGAVTQVYTNDGKDTHYQVAPNHIWEV